MKARGEKALWRLAAGCESLAVGARWFARTHHLESDGHIAYHLESDGYVANHSESDGYVVSHWGGDG